MSDAGISGDLDLAIQTHPLLKIGIQALIVKRGAKGASVFLPDGAMQDVPGFPVEIYNILGGGATPLPAALSMATSKGGIGTKRVAWAMRVGAIVVMRHGCANFMGYEDEVLAFVEERGGF